MRIIGGSRRGKVLPSFDKLDLRPTTDFAKESLFNILQHRIALDGIHFLDLFAGTGGISFEFMSRSAQSGVMVDISPGSQRYRVKILEQIGWDDLQSIRSDVFKFIKTCSGSFDIIFADPPFDLPELLEIPDLIFQHGLLKPDGRLILEHHERATFGKHPHFEEHRKYGAVNFTFFKNSQS